MSHEILFSIGDTVVYPTRGVGCVKDIEIQDISGHVLQVYVIHFDHDQLTIRLPITKTQSSGLRKLCAPDVNSFSRTRSWRARGWPVILIPLWRGLCFDHEYSH